MWVEKGNYILFFLFLIIPPCHAQSDSVTFTYNEYLENIAQFHPIAKKANLRSEFAKAEWRSAKGNFDPVLTSDWKEKDFKDKLYYRQYEAKLQIPTRLGIDIVGGYQNTDGVFLNPENSTSEFGLWNLGLEVNILQGLFVNERKTALNQAKIFQNLAENQRQIMLNELYYTASIAYLKWQQYYYYQETLANNITIAKTYFENTKESHKNGEKTAMDTLEAFILYQDASILFQKNEVNFVKIKQNVENYLWYDQVPVALQKNTKPEGLEEGIFQPTTDSLTTDVVVNNPLILASVNKQAYLEVEQKLKREKLKPKLKVKYNALLSTSSTNISPSYAASDFKWGFGFSMPLFLRTERGNVQKGKIKIQEVALGIENKRNELQNKLEASLEKQVILRQQLALLSQNVTGYRLLLEGENEKFRYGESSVFLLNKRQEKYINGQLKLIDLRIKLQIESLNYLYYSNTLISS
jgi:outer membrane protein TolC